MHREVPAQPLGSEAGEAILLANMRGARSSRVAFGLGHPAQPKLLDGHSCECRAWIQWTVQICRSQQAMNRTVGNRSLERDAGNGMTLPASLSARSGLTGLSSALQNVAAFEGPLGALRRFSRRSEDHRGGVFQWAKGVSPIGRLGPRDNAFEVSLRILSEGRHLRLLRPRSSGGFWGGPSQALASSTVMMVFRPTLVSLRRPILASS